MGFAYKIAAIEGETFLGLNQITNIELTVSGAITGSWKIVFDGGAYEYTITHTTGDLTTDLDAFLSAEYVNIFNDTGFIISYTLTANGADISLEGMSGTAVISTVDISSSNVYFNVELIRNAAVAVGRPQITDVVFSQDGGFPINGQMGIDISPGPAITYNVDLVGDGSIEAAIDGFISSFTGVMLSSFNLNVSKVGTDTIRFTGADNSTIRTITVTDNSTNVAYSVNEIQASQAGTSLANQITWIEFTNPTPPTTGFIDVVITQGSLVRSYPLVFTTGDIRTDMNAFRASYRSDIYRNHRIVLSSVSGITDGARIGAYGRSPGTSWVTTFDNDNTNATSFINDVQAASPSVSDTALAYGSERLLYGFKTDEADYIAVRNQKNRIEHVLTLNWQNILDNEFNTSVLVTGEFGRAYMLNGLKILSLKEDGAGSIIKYNLYDDIVKEFKVQEDVATIEAAVDAL